MSAVPRVVRGVGRRAPPRISPSGVRQLMRDITGLDSPGMAAGGVSATFKFPTTLEGFGYKFDDSGRLRDSQTNGPFVFEVRPGDRDFNQARYEALGAVMDEHIYGLLEREGLARVQTPITDDYGYRGPRGFFFATPDAKTASRLLVIIHGAGVVRAGQWSRRLIINDSLDSGSVLPYVRRARRNGWGVVVTNTNQNRDETGKPLPGSGRPEEHGVHVWGRFVAPAAAEKIAIVAHSYGGIVTGAIAASHTEDVVRRVCAVAFTDAVQYHVRTEAEHKFFVENSINWVTSDKPLNTPLKGRMPERSAGTTTHEYTSWSAFEPVFAFLEDRMRVNSAASARQDL